MENHDTRATAWDTVNAYHDSLNKLDALTDRLAAAIAECRVNDLDSILRERERLCRETAQARRTAGPSPDRIRKIEESILRRQSQCEADLTVRLAECRTELAGLRRKKGVKSAYASASTESRSCFLDNRT